MSSPISQFIPTPYKFYFIMIIFTIYLCIFGRTGSWLLRPGFY